jgi:hypothetical protein
MILDLLTGPLGLLLALAGWVLLQAVVLPRLGVGT